MLLLRLLCTKSLWRQLLLLQSLLQLRIGLLVHSSMLIEPTRLTGVCSGGDVPPWPLMGTVQCPLLLLPLCLLLKLLLAQLLELLQLQLLVLSLAQWTLLQTGQMGPGLPADAVHAEQKACHWFVHEIQRSRRNQSPADCLGFPC